MQQFLGLLGPLHAAHQPPPPPPPPAHPHPQPAHFLAHAPIHFAPPHHHHHPQQHHAAHAHHMAHHAAAHAHHGAHGSSHAAVSIEFLQNLAVQSPLDVYDIHETGWRRALLLAKRDRHEYLVRYIGWDSKWDEWIRGTSGRLAPSNSRTAALAYTGFKGPKSADEVASVELGRDWNAARQEGVMCDVLFALHVGPTSRRPGLRVGNVTPLSGVSPLKRNNSRRDEHEAKGLVTQSAPSTPATSPMVRGLSNLGFLSPSVGPTASPASAAASSPPIYFSAHSHIIQMRCPDLLKQALISLPPIASFEEATPTTIFTRTMSHSNTTNDERKEEMGGRSLADQEASAPAASTASPSSILNYHLADVDLPSASPELSSATPALEEKVTSLDDDDDLAAGGASRSASISGPSGYSELHPSVTTYDLICVPNAATMQNLLTYIYTGDLSMNLLTSIRHVFELATAAHLFHLDRLMDLCALALNRMLTQENFLLALRLGLHFQSKVLGNLDTICSALQDATAAATHSLASELHSAMVTTANAKIHPHLSPLVRVSFEFLMLHWDICWSNYENMVALQQLPSSIFQVIMRMMPIKNVASAPFAPIYPAIHPQACNLTSHFKRLYEERTSDNTDFRIIVGEDEAEYVIHVHKAVLACRSEYFRALFRCSFEEGKDSCVRLDSTQHNPASIEALVKYLYAADLKVDPNCVVYLSNCTDFFGLSSNALEHACQELVSQHHCLKVLRSAWQSCNEGLFKRACKFIDWTTLATLMHGPRNDTSMELDAAAEAEAEQIPVDAEEEESDDDAEDDDDDEGDEDDGEDDDVEAEEEIDIEVDDDAAEPTAPAAAVASITASPLSSAHSTPTSHRSRAASSSPASPSIDVSDVEMWKAIVAEKANPTSGTFGKTNANTKRARTSAY